MRTAWVRWLRPAGIASRTSLVSARCAFAFWTSTTGDSPLTVIVSARLPTLSSALTDAVNDPLSSMPSRLTVLNPVRENVTEYTPGLRSTIRYWPEPSVTADRTFSIRTGLEASTVTPGRIAPDASWTTPVIEAWAKAETGRVTNQVSTNRTLLTARIRVLLLLENLW